MSGNDLFDIAICTIFAREFLEGAVIVGNFRTVIQRSNLPDDDEQAAALAADGEEREPVLTKKQMLRCVTCSAFWASVFAIMVVLAVAIPLAVLSRNFDETVAMIIEGISKIVAAFAIMLLSLKIPKWLGFYKSKKKGKIDDSMDLTMNGVRFNVAWNVWREVAECGVFLLPSFLTGEKVAAIPISGLVGMVIGLAIGYLIYYANLKFKNKFWVALLVTLVLVFLSAGLFTGGCHEFEEIYGETPDVWEAENPFWSSSKLPMAILKPFGYSSSRTVLQITTYWCWLFMCAVLHGMLMWKTKKINQELAALAEQAPLKTVSDNNFSATEKGVKDDNDSDDTKEATNDDKLDSNSNDPVP